MVQSQDRHPDHADEVARLRARVAELEAQLERQPDRSGDSSVALDLATPEQLRLLVDNAPGVIYLCRNDARYTMLFLTEPVQGLTGYTAGEFLRDRVSFMELFHPDDAPQIAREVEAALAERRPFRMRYRIRHKAGHWVWIDETGVGVFEGDELLYLEGFLQDVSAYELAQRELRRTHDKLARHFDHTPLAIMEWDQQWRLTRWAGQAQRIFGWSAEDLLGKNWGDWDFVHPDDLERVQGVAMELVESRTSSNVCRNRNLCKDGSVVHCEWFNSGIHDENGRLTSMMSFVTDITDQVRAEAALRQSERRYREIIDTAYEGVWILDTQANTTLVNQRMPDMLATTIDEMIGVSLMSYIDPGDRESVVNRLQRRAQGVSEQHEFRFLRRDGQHIWTIVSTTPILDEDGGYAGAVGMITDITDRVEAEENVRRLNADLEARVAQRTSELEAVNLRLKSEIRDREDIARVLYEQSHTMELMLESTAEGVVVADRDGNFLIWNAAARQIIGLDKEAMPAEEWAEFYQCYHADGQTLYETRDLPMVRAINGESLDDCQMVVRRPEKGIERLLSINARPMVSEAGTVIGGVIVFRDNTEHRRTEAALRLVQTAIEQVGDSVVITDAEIEKPGPHILYVNPAFTQLTGYTEDEVIYASPRMLQGPETDRAILDKVRAALAAGQVFHGHTVNYRKDGTSFDVEWHIAPVRDAQGRITNWVSIQRDITDRQLREQMKREHQAELAHVARLSTMGEMASGLAHELNQPLAAISNYISGCLRRFESGQFDQAQLAEALRRVGQQSERAGQVIQRLREFVKKGEPRRGPVDVNAAVREAVSLVEHDARAARVGLRLELADDLPTVEGDAIQLEQVILNIVRNAVEAAEAGGRESARVGVRIRSAHDRAERRVLVTVTDRGVGASPEDLEQVFNPFFSTKLSGMGMGLNISQSIAEAHHGRLWAQANPDRGLTFSLALPASPNGG